MYQLYCLGLFYGGSQELPKQCYLACVIVLVCFYKTGISFFHYLQGYTGFAVHYGARRVNLSLVVKGLV